MRRLHSLVVLLGLLTALAIPVSAAGNAPPTAAAGLDQTVTSGTTVYLDGANSHDPDGRIQTVEWSIRDPNGATVAPSCRNCLQPTFTPNVTGRWSVTVTVTDDDGATATDTLYVTVEEARGPTLTLDGPDRVVPDESTPFVVEATSDGAPLRSVSLYHDDTRVNSTTVDGTTTLTTLTHTFSETGSTELLAAVTDEAGYVNTTTITVDPTTASAARVGDRCDEGERRVYMGGSIGSMCSSTALIYETRNDVTMVVPTGGASQDGIQLYNDEQGEIVTVATGEQVQELRRENEDGVIALEDVEKTYEENKDNGMYSPYDQSVGNIIENNEQEYEDAIENMPVSMTESGITDVDDTTGSNSQREESEESDDGNDAAEDDNTTSNSSGCPPVNNLVPPSVRHNRMSC
ncbi:PKD domain-containing protein [Halomicrobium mukohataei]|uniref:PKD domain-containing protein n=1 Tax=Halomicrobium mukohataei TaxID=57705 RepID=A0A847UF66_9EURY|nr:PKD domain-containing protein [Halomicrobium mukohataei]NLV09751.1 PKD domain-containing protein [Halomicrobium mukohataei]